ncbi:hypothetical protein DFJ58DRAFT_722194 [Suillus subalutaceus]|uniref:uncharacterized protein n=1 Tax=Suillus subalutaceus TaxID=48586 RepID=UPI001B85EE7F|nr:uncharacterized protein DFJ58DRAFT_722194 [Suillus subalutaceus]KAG1873023.1 hypothetical protein DFJ58DRAFT_722194 [Suillus subalutaceus]
MEHLSLPLIVDICPSLTLKVAFVDACGHDDGTLLNPTIECEIVRDADAGHDDLPNT